MATLEPLNLSKLRSETRKIFNAQRRNFYALSFLFLLPPSIAILLYPTLQSLFPDTNNNKPVNGTPTKTILLALVIYVFNVVFSVCALGSITYTAFHGFSGKVIELKSAIKSISTSFFPLLCTTLIAHIIVFMIALIILYFLAIFGFLLVSGFRIEYIFSSPYFVRFVIALMVVMVLVVLHLQVNWAIAPVVLVAESTWGFEALKLSKTLIKGKRGLVLSLYLVLGFAYGVYVWINYDSTSGGADDWNSLWLLLALQVFVSSGFLSLIQLSNMIAMTVLYAYCKAQKEFSGDQYVSLLVDHDEKDAVV